MSREQSGGRFRRLLVLIALGGLVFLFLAAFRAGPAPQISAESDLPGIGKRTKITIGVIEPKRGLSEVRVELVQGERAEELAVRSYTPREPWQFWGVRRIEDQFSVEVGSEVLPGLKEGPAKIRVSAARAGAWLRSPTPATFELELPIKLRPPGLQIISNTTYISQGGCEAVVYRVGPSAARDGVQSGDWWFPGYPLPGGTEGERFALFGAAFDLAGAELIRLVAEDDVGNVATASFIDRFKRKPIKGDTIRLSQGFISRVVPAILAQSPEVKDRGDMLENYLAINGELRASNAQTLTEMAANSPAEFLWRGEFAQMRNAQVMSDFADRRTYVFEGRPVDTQDHLGFDLASTRMAEIPSANDGVVVLARYFGIYGNAVVVDHGYGLMSLYGHLSSIAVEEGQQVARGESLGRSGETGLAGGDHLHFTMLLHGLAVNPIEWWDDHWIHDRLMLKLGDALPS